MAIIRSAHLSPMQGFDASDHIPGGLRKSQAQASRRVGLESAENVDTRAKIDLTTKPAFVSGMFTVSVYLTFAYGGLHLKGLRIPATNSLAPENHKRNGS